MMKKSVNIVRIAGVVFLVVFLYGTSISLTFYNKWMSKRYRFPLTVSTIHFTVVFLLSMVARKLLSLYNKEERIVLEWGQYFRKVFPTAISASLDIGLSNWSIMLSTVSLYTMAKSTTIIFIMLFSFLFGLEKLSCKLLLVVLLIATGLVMFTFESKQFDAVGFIMAILASMMAGVRWTTAQLIMQKKSLGLSNPLDTIYHVQPIMSLTMIIIAFVMEGPEIASSDLLFRAPSAQVALTSTLIILSGAFLAFLLTVSEFLLVSVTSSLALSVAGIFKEVCTLTIATEFGGDRWTSLNFIGLVICLTGISFHVVSNATKETPEKENKHEDPDNIAMASLLHDGFSESDEDDVFFDSRNRVRMKRFKFLSVQHGD